MTDRAVIKDFITAGDARLTLKSGVTGAHYTFRVSSMRGTGTRFFVAVMTGGAEGYVYVGLFDAEEGTLNLTAKSRFNKSDLCVAAFRYFLRMLFGTEPLPLALEIMHEGACGRCARPLTHPESIATGLGPECAKRARGRSHLMADAA